MPLRLEGPIVRVEPDAMHTIETRNPEKLHCLWSVLSKCSPAMEDGKRYENLAWRLWSRETFCCANDFTFPPRWSFERRLPTCDAEVPELSSSVASDDSHAGSAITATTRSNPQCNYSASSQPRGKHTTRIDLEKVVSSIQEKRAIAPLSPLPEQLAARPPPTPEVVMPTKASTDTTPRPLSPLLSSTAATALDSVSAEFSPHSIVHGFNPGCISTSIRTSMLPKPEFHITPESEEAIESGSETDSDDNAIEEDESEDDDDWEDDDNNDGSMQPSVKDPELFKRVDSKPDLRSRRSLITTMMHEKDRAHALQNMASRSTPAIRRSRTSSPNGPSTGNSPQEDQGLMMRPQVSRSKPIIMTTSNVHPPALSPLTTRRNMLQTELTQSLRQNLLWERQQKNLTTNAVNKRAQVGSIQQHIISWNAAI